MALDTLSRAMQIECCWIQTIDGRKHALFLAADRGFSAEMHEEVSAMDMGHGFSEQVIGRGHQVIIPDLSSDGLYGLASFRKAGYKWLVAVPLMTYRVHGVLGIASRQKKHLHRETADLTMLVAGLIGTALNKTQLFQKSLKQEKTGKPPKIPGPPPPAVETTDAIPQSPPERPAPGQADTAFDSHAHRMKLFRRAHR